MNAGEITDTLETALNGKKVSEAVEGQRRFDVVLRFADEARNNLDALKNVTIDTPNGTQIPVSAVATIENLPGPNQVLRENTKRRIVVSIECRRDAIWVRSCSEMQLEKIKAQVSNCREGYFIEYGGQFEAQKEATQNAFAI